MGDILKVVNLEVVKVPELSVAITQFGGGR